MRGDRRTPVAGGRDDGGPREGRRPGQAWSTSGRPWRSGSRSGGPWTFRCRPGRGAAPALPTPT